jgi:hypothetical protein
MDCRVKPGNDSGERGERHTIIQSPDFSNAWAAR